MPSNVNAQHSPASSALDRDQQASPIPSGSTSVPVTLTIRSKKQQLPSLAKLPTSNNEHGMNLATETNASKTRSGPNVKFSKDNKALPSIADQQSINKPSNVTQHATTYQGSDLQNYGLGSEHTSLDTGHKSDKQIDSTGAALVALGDKSFAPSVNPPLTKGMLPPLKPISSKEDVLALSLATPHQPFAPVTTVMTQSRL